MRAGAMAPHRRSQVQHKNMRAQRRQGGDRRQPPRLPFAEDGRRAAVPADQEKGHLPLSSIRPLSPHSTSRLARQADTGLALHEALPVDEYVAVHTANETSSRLCRRQRRRRCQTGGPPTNAEQMRYGSSNRSPTPSTETSTPVSTSWSPGPRESSSTDFAPSRVDR